MMSNLDAKNLYWDSGKNGIKRVILKKEMDRDLK
jgi:hypothetical protein